MANLALPIAMYHMPMQGSSFVSWREENSVTPSTGPRLRKHISKPGVHFGRLTMFDTLSRERISKKGR